MAQHKRRPQFIKIITTDKNIVCLNPEQVSNFQIQKDAQLWRPKPGITRPKDESEVEHYTGSAVKFYFPSGQGLEYVVGRDITEQDFDYIVGILNEWVYLSQPEFESMQAAKQAAELEKWQQVMEDEAPEPVPGDPDYVAKK